MEWNHWQTLYYVIEVSKEFSIFVPFGVSDRAFDIWQHKCWKMQQGNTSLERELKEHNSTADLQIQIQNLDNVEDMNSFVLNSSETSSKNSSPSLKTSPMTSYDSSRLVKVQSVKNLRFRGNSHPSSFTLGLARVRCLRSSPWFRLAKQFKFSG